VFYAYYYILLRNAATFSIYTDMQQVCICAFRIHYLISHSILKVLTETFFLNNTVYSSEKQIFFMLIIINSLFEGDSDY